MNILLTNDDGINALGIKKVESILKQYGNVYVVAPKYEQSGKGCSINAFKGVNIEKIDNNHIAVEGSPVDCVEIALSILNVDFDLVVSGCNAGYNLSQDIMYSGTCGACLQASFGNCKAVALSIKNQDYFDLLDTYLPMTMDFIFKNDLLSTNYFLNVNFPINLNKKQFKITKVKDIIKESYYLIDNTMENNYIVARKSIDENVNQDVDFVAVKNGFISITPLSQSLYKNNLYNQIKRKIK